MTLLTLGLYLLVLFCYGLAQSSFLDNFMSIPAALRSQEQQRRFSPCCLLSPPPPPLFPPPPALWHRNSHEDEPRRPWGVRGQAITRHFDYDDNGELFNNDYTSSLNKRDSPTLYSRISKNRSYPHLSGLMNSSQSDSLITETGYTQHNPRLIQHDYMNQYPAYLVSKSDNLYYNTNKVITHRSTTLSPSVEPVDFHNDTIIQSPPSMDNFTEKTNIVQSNKIKSTTLSCSKQMTDKNGLQLHRQIIRSQSGPNLNSNPQINLHLDKITNDSKSYPKNIKPKHLFVFEHRSRSRSRSQIKCSSTSELYNENQLNKDNCNCQTVKLELIPSKSKCDGIYSVPQHDLTSDTTHCHDFKFDPKPIQRSASSSELVAHVTGNCNGNEKRELELLDCTSNYSDFDKISKLKSKNFHKMVTINSNKKCIPTKYSQLHNQLSSSSLSLSSISIGSSTHSLNNHHNTRERIISLQRNNEQESNLDENHNQILELTSYNISPTSLSSSSSSFSLPALQIHVWRNPSSVENNWLNLKARLNLDSPNLNLKDQTELLSALTSFPDIYRELISRFIIAAGKLANLSGYSWSNIGIFERLKSFGEHLIHYVRPPWIFCLCKEILLPPDMQNLFIGGLLKLMDLHESIQNQFEQLTDNLPVASESSNPQSQLTYLLIDFINSIKSSHSILELITIQVETNSCDHVTVKNWSKKFESLANKLVWTLDHIENEDPDFNDSNQIKIDPNDDCGNRHKLIQTIEQIDQCLIGENDIQTTDISLQVLFKLLVSLYRQLYPEPKLKYPIDMMIGILNIYAIQITKKKITDTIIAYVPLPIFQRLSEQASSIDYCNQLYKEAQTLVKSYPSY